MGQAAGGQGGDRVHRAVQRLRLGRRSRHPAGHLRPARPRHDPGVLRTLDLAAAAAADHRRPRRRVLVGPDHAASGNLPHHRARRPPPRPILLRSPRGRQPRPRPPRARRDHLRAPTRPQGRRGVQDRDRPAHRRRHHQRVLPTLPGQAVPQGRPCPAHRNRDQRRLRHRLPTPATNLDDLQAKARAINQRLLDTERVGQALSLRVQPLRGSRSPPSPTMAGGPQP